MSINTSKVVGTSDVMNRQHVMDILHLLRDAGLRPVEKSVIAKKLELKPANLFTSPRSRRASSGSAITGLWISAGIVRWLSSDLFAQCHQRSNASLTRTPP